MIAMTPLHSQEFCVGYGTVWRVEEAAACYRGVRRELAWQRALATRATPPSGGVSAPHTHMHTHVHTHTACQPTRGGDAPSEPTAPWHSAHRYTPDEALAPSQGLGATMYRTFLQPLACWARRRSMALVQRLEREIDDLSTRWGGASCATPPGGGRRASPD